MSIKEITSRIKILQANALQDYLEIVIHESNISLSDWIQQYATFVESQREKNIPNVAEVYKRISLKGIDSIDIKQLDTSAIINYVKHGPIKLKKPEKKEKTECYLNLLQGDRNTDAHVHGNETTREMYQSAVIQLAHLMDFVDYVWSVIKNEKIGERYEYAKKYKERIYQILMELDQCYRKEIIENNRSIKYRIINNKRQFIGLLLIAIGVFIILYKFQHILETILSIVEK